MKSKEYLYILVSLLSASAYVFAAAAKGAVGFALDDAWIHQVYARNLAQHGEFAFFPGQPSAGSTSPLWTIVLAPSFLLQIDGRLWSYLIGAIVLGLAAIVAARLTLHLIPNFSSSRPSLAVVVALFLLLEWHMAWGAVSGMEIPLFVFLSLLLLERLYGGGRSWVMGVIAGLLTLTRPEGVVLAALVGVATWQGGAKQVDLSRKEAEQRSSLGRALAYALALSLVVTPYLLFNMAISGTLLPNTFFAKNVEYAIAFESVPLLFRWVQLLAVPWIGAQLLLLPGFVFVSIALAIRRKWLALIPVAWTLLLPALYALRLPVSYQHGRYEMPVIPFLVIYGVWGTAALLERLKSRILRRTWALATAVLAAAFWFIGANAYSTDVSIIDCEMVQTARWVADNVPPGTKVAAHDIGALGYFYPYPFIDLAGLVSPEIIPVMSDQARLRQFMVRSKVEYAVFFPDWYPALASDQAFAAVYQQNCPATREAGGTDMVVYKVLSSQK